MSGLLLPLSAVGLSVGVTLAVTGSPPMRRTTLDERIAPYLGGEPTTSRLLATSETVTPWPTFERLVAPGARRVVTRLEPWLGSSSGLRIRLDRLGDGRTVEQYRIEQIQWGVVGALGSLLLVVARAYGGHPPGLLPSVVLACVGGLFGLLLRDRRLTSQISGRLSAMREELPTIAELLALSVAAGEGTTAALDRVSRVGNGALVEQLRSCLADVRSGVPLARSLESMAARLQIPELDRFVAAVCVALERGTPLAPVLQAQAVDARDAGRRALIEVGGRKEIAMMVPVVFLVLPVSVLFALFPGFYGLTLSSP